jgi:hypothetical protein
MKHQAFVLGIVDDQSSNRGRLVIHKQSQAASSLDFGFRFAKAIPFENRSAPRSRNYPLVVRLPLWRPRVLALCSLVQLLNEPD